MIEKKDFKKLKFETDEEKRMAIDELRSFLNSNGWKFMKKFIDINILNLENQILEGRLNKEINMSQEDVKRELRLFLMALKDLPEDELLLQEGGEDEASGELRGGEDPY